MWKTDSVIISQMIIISLISMKRLIKTVINLNLRRGNVVIRTLDCGHEFKSHQALDVIDFKKKDASESTTLKIVRLHLVVN